MKKVLLSFVLLFAINSIVQAQSQSLQIVNNNTTCTAYVQIYVDALGICGSGSISNTVAIPPSSSAAYANPSMVPGSSLPATDSFYAVVVNPGCVNSKIVYDCPGGSMLANTVDISVVPLCFTCFFGSTITWAPSSTLAVVTIN